jgi:hypothetical protein
LGPNNGPTCQWKEAESNRPKSRAPEAAMIYIGPPMRQTRPLTCAQRSPLHFFLSSPHHSPTARFSPLRVLPLTRSLCALLLARRSPALVCTPSSPRHRRDGGSPCLCASELRSVRRAAGAPFPPSSLAPLRPPLLPSCHHTLRAPHRR